MIIGIYKLATREEGNVEERNTVLGLSFYHVFKIGVGYNEYICICAFICAFI